ncbi:hypothetical protein EON67_11970 [archaeon]|nr:MAG: hypothetical protein EON67_11970 [archaeon]
MLLLGMRVCVRARARVCVCVKLGWGAGAVCAPPSRVAAVVMSTPRGTPPSLRCAACRRVDAFQYLCVQGRGVEARWLHAYRCERARAFTAPRTLM